MNRDKIKVLIIVVFTIVVINTLFNIISLNILAMKFLLPISVAIIGMFIVLTNLFLINKSKYFLRVLIILMCVMLSITTFYIRKSNGTIRKITNAKDGYTQVSVIVMKNNEASNLIDLKGDRLVYSETGQTEYTYKSLSDLQKELHDDITLIKYKSMETSVMNYLVVK